MSEWTCDQCGKVFRRMPCHTKGAKHFCCQKCRGLYYRVHSKHSKGNFSMQQKLNYYAKLRKAMIEVKE